MSTIVLIIAIFAIVVEIAALFIEDLEQPILCGVVIILQIVGIILGFSDSASRMAYAIAEVVSVGVFVLFACCDLSDHKIIGWIILITTFLGLCGWVFDRSNTLVKQGERGVKTVWGKVVPKSYEPGLVKHWPFTEKYGNKVFKVPIRPQRYRYSIPVRTKELQSVTLDCAVLLQLTPDSVHVLYDKYTGYQDYEKNVVQDLVQSTMLTITSQLSFWSFAEEINSMVSEAVEYIVNDQLMLQNLAKIEAFRLKGYQASAEIEALIDQTAQARQGVELEKWRLEKAKVETERVKQEALQTYERLAAVAKANGIDVQIKAEALKNNPFVAQYEMAKALQNWNGSMTLPNTLMTMSQAANGNGGASIFPIIPITTR